MTRIVRAALTQTVNAYRRMPTSVADLPKLADQLEAIREANVDHHVTLLQTAASHGAQVICFGELFTGPYFAFAHDPMWFGLAEDAGMGPTVTRMQRAARDAGMVVIAPIYERDSSGRKFNTAVVISAGGELLGKFRKAHIPYGTNEQGTFVENYFYDRSDGNNCGGPENISKNPYFPVFETEIGRIGIAICYDRHFEGVMSTLAQNGAQLVFSPAVTFGNKSQRMWPLEFQVDAARHNLFIGGSNRKGAEPPWNQEYFGESHFVGPNGVLPNASSHAELIIADVDLRTLDRPDPSGWNLQRDRRPDIYTSASALSAPLGNSRRQP